MIDIVNGLLLRANEVLLVKRSPERRNYPNTWSFPGGHVEPGEALEAALIRELQEELSIAPTEFTLLTTLDDPADRTITYHLYQVTSWAGGDPALTGDEHTEMKWVTPEQAHAVDGLALDEYRPVFAQIG